MAAIADQLGRVGLPQPISSLATMQWDAIVVGGGHNGLTCAAYLARAGQRVLVLEARERLGGACTLDRPFEDTRFVVSPCAYLVGLLDERVIRELELRERGLQIYVADPEVWVPFDDGTAFAQWIDDAKTQASLEALGVSKRDIDGYWDYGKLYRDIRLRLRKGDRDAWVGDSPTRTEIEELLGGDEYMADVVFRASIAEVLDEYMSDSRLKDALFAGGIIGTFAGPKDPGTASVKLMHRMGELEGRGAVWGYVRGGMGMVSFAIAEVAADAGAVLATGVPVAEVMPGEGVRLDDDTVVRASRVISNADPKTLLTLLGENQAPASFRHRIEAWDVRSATIKFNAALHTLPDFAAAPGQDFMTFGTIDLTSGLEASQQAFEACRGGEPSVSLAEIYVQTAHDKSVAPDGHHSISIFAQYAPYDIKGGWDTRRDDVAKQIVDLVSRFAPDFEHCIESAQLLTPQDIENRIGLTGGHIFQGSVLPDQMWDRRLSARTEVPGVYLCGAATHPAGSVIGLNGRNAAMAVLADAELAR